MELNSMYDSRYKQGYADAIGLCLFELRGCKSVSEVKDALERKLMYMKKAG